MKHEITEPNGLSGTHADPLLGVTHRAVSAFLRVTLEKFGRRIRSNISIIRIEIFHEDVITIACHAVSPARFTGYRNIFH